MLDKVFKPVEVENKIYRMWEGGSYFVPKIEKGKKPFSILLPPPNANADLHLGHAMYTIQDILIRFHRMAGDQTLWLPGADHAGFETQVVYEKHLAKIGKSRFDFDRETLYKNIFEFVLKNRKAMQDQLRRLGFSLDWNRDTLTIDDHVVKTVYETFKKMYKNGLVYRSDYMVNFCPKCGTTFAELEIDHVERVDPLYYMKYGPFTLATVRPETKFGDTAVAVNPKDKRYKKWIGKEIEVEGLEGRFKLKVIADDYVDPKFGTGVVKVTPAHDKNDYEASKRHNLEIRPVIDLNGRLNDKCGKYAGLKIREARAAVVEELSKKGLLVKIDENYKHTVATCYKGGHDIEPTIIPNWFIKVDPLKKDPITAVKKGRTKIYPKRFEKIYFNWLERMHDWPISRQVVWGIRIPVWYDTAKNPNLQVEFLDSTKNKISGKIKELLGKYSFEEIKSGLQRTYAPAESFFEISPVSLGEDFIQETDTFDTWFSSGQWPLVTLHYPDGEDFKYFYPTTVMETGYDILEFWVARMMMFGLYLTGKVPFENVYLHGLVRDSKGQKMSKSKGNVINPMELIEKYGADAVRMALVLGVGAGADQNLSEDKIRGMRNFANKVWNIGRFISLNIKERDLRDHKSDPNKYTKEDQVIFGKIILLTQRVTRDLEKFRFSGAAEKIYQFIWHDLADSYIEYSKSRINDGDSEILKILLDIFSTCLKLLHPFMPFVTEAVWQELPRGHDEPLIISQWPKTER